MRGHSGVVIGNDDDVLGLGVGFDEAGAIGVAVEGEVDGFVEAGEIAEAPVFDCRLNSAAVAFGGEGGFPAAADDAAWATPGKVDDADFVARGERFGGFDGALGAPVISIRGFGGVHAEDQRTFGNFALGGDFHDDGEFLFEA